MKVLKKRNYSPRALGSTKMTKLKELTNLVNTRTARQVLELRFIKLLSMPKENIHGRSREKVQKRAPRTRSIQRWFGHVKVKKPKQRPDVPKV